MRAKRLPTFRSVCFLGAGRDFVFRCIACFPRRKQGFRALCEVSGSVSAERSGSFGQLGQARTAADSLGQGKAGNELPQNCRRFAAVFPFPFPFPSCAQEKRSDCRPRLTRSNALHFTPCGRAENHPERKTLYGASRASGEYVRKLHTLGLRNFQRKQRRRRVCSPAYEKSPK